jgi:hypothetical protein
MTDTTVRDQVLRVVEEMSTDVTIADIMDRLYLMQKIERGRQQIGAGEGVPHAEAKRSMKRWHE